MKTSRKQITKYISLIIGTIVLSTPIVTIVHKNIVPQTSHQTNNKILHLNNAVKATDDYFTFRQINDKEYFVSGLSEKGKTKAILAIPSEYQGGVVTSVDDYAFANNSILEQIMIPSNILTVGLSAFYNCSQLSYVHVLSNNTRFLDYSLDTHTIVDLRIEVPSDYSLKAMFGIDGTQKEARLSYNISSRPSRLYWTNMPPDGLDYTHYFQDIIKTSAVLELSAFTERNSHVSHKIVINGTTPPELSNLWLFFGVLVPTEQKWYQSIEGTMNSVNPDKWTFRRYNWYYRNRIVYSLNNPNGTYINSGYSSYTYTSWDAVIQTNWSVCHYDVIVDDNGYVASSVYEQDAQYDQDSHKKPNPKSHLNYDMNNIYKNGTYVGGW